MLEKNPEAFLHSHFELAEIHPQRLQPLLDHVTDSINSKAASLRAAGKNIEVRNPDWCYANPEEAGKMHADMIIDAYGPTYALPNKDPIANAEALRGQTLGMYLMLVDDELTGTACMADMGNGVAELGRSASKGKTGNSIIQDLRIFDWLTNDEIANKYHTLFTTLRSAIDRDISLDGGEDFVMRGGQAVTHHWKKMPGLTVNGVAPLYFKQGKLEQFSYASITRAQYEADKPLYIDHDVSDVIRAWHEQYGFMAPVIALDTGSQEGHYNNFSVKYPPAESGLTDLVHADINLGNDNDEQNKSLSECITEAEFAGSPFVQVFLPVDRNTLSMQKELQETGFRVYGYIPGTQIEHARLIYGRVRDGVNVVQTSWSAAGQDNPFWASPILRQFANSVETGWDQ